MVSLQLIKTTIKVQYKKAFLFDLNGTMINDMEYHITAWHRILNELGAKITYRQMQHECYGKNHELLERIFPGRFSTAEKTKMSIEKETRYQNEYRASLKLIDGLDGFLKTALNANTPMAIGSAAIKTNIDFVLDGLNIRKYFAAVVSAEDVFYSKPHPETYLKCASLLGFCAADCIVFEDTPKGVECALNAGMQAVVLTTTHRPNEFTMYDNVIAFAADYNELPASLI
jgi:beta-phosphoglucomutase